MKLFFHLNQTIFCKNILTTAIFMFGTAYRCSWSLDDTIGLGKHSFLTSFVLSILIAAKNLLSIILWQEKNCVVLIEYLQSFLCDILMHEASCKTIFRCYQVNSQTWEFCRRTKIFLVVKRITLSSSPVSTM